MSDNFRCLQAMFINSKSLLVCSLVYLVVCGFCVLVVWCFFFPESSRLFYLGKKLFCVIICALIINATLTLNVTTKSICFARCLNSVISQVLHM